MSEFLKPPVGTSDHLGAEQDRRIQIINDVRSVYASYGFTAVETPVIENIPVLEKGYRGSQEQRLFRIMARGEELDRRIKDILVTDEEISEKDAGELADLGLRYDLTVPLSRIIEQYRGKIRFPFKRYQISPVWRTDRPSSGRYREFTMLDADTVGSTSLMDDAESIAIVLSVFDKLKIPPYLQVNNRNILEGFADLSHIPAEQRSKFLKSLSRIGQDPQMNSELLNEFGIDGELGDKLITIVSEIKSATDIDEKIMIIKKHLGQFPSTSKGLEEITEVLKYLDDSQLSQVQFNPLLARGIEYYTGTIIDTKIKGKPREKSSFNGGRYDNVVGIFSDQRLPTVGVTLSLERLMNGLDPETGIQKAECIVLTSDQASAKPAFAIGKHIRDSGVNAMVYPYAGEGLGKQLKYAAGIDATHAIIVDQSATERGVIKIKNLKTGEQIEVNSSNFNSDSLNL